MICACLYDLTYSTYISWIGLHCYVYHSLNVTRLHVHRPEYCQQYAKPEDIGAVPEEKSSDEELSEDESDSGDEQVAGPVDP